MSLLQIDVDNSLTDELYEEKFLSSIDECTSEELNQMAILIVDYWVKNKPKVKSKNDPYKSTLLYKGLGTSIDLNNLPPELRIRLYSYVKHIFG